MPINALPYISFDLETSGLDSQKHDAIQVAAKAYDGRTLEPYPDGEFNSLAKPVNWDNIDDEALAVNKITREELKAAPEQKVVWHDFVSWVKRFNTKGTVYTAPIVCGKNIRNFDLKFVEEMNKRHFPAGKKVVLFNRQQQLELQDLLWVWFENSADLPNYKMDTVRPYFGIPSEGAHRADVDARQTGDLIMRFLRLHRELKARKDKDGNPLIRFKP